MISLSIYQQGWRKYVIEPGEFSIVTGPNSVDLISTTWTIGD